MPENGQPTDHWVLGFNWAIDRQAMHALLATVQKAVDLKAKTVTLSLSSPGGIPEQAFYAYEILTALQTHVELITHNIGVIQSAAMMLFMAGSKRYAAPNTTFLIHETTHNTGGPVSADHVALGAASIKADDLRAMAIVADRTGKDLATVRKWFAGQKLRDTTFAKDANIISDVASLQISSTSRFHQVAL